MWGQAQSKISGHCAGAWSWLGAASSLGIALALAGCAAPKDVGRKELIVGNLFSETEIARVADLMARDLVREPLLHGSGNPPRIAFVKVDNDTNQYFFANAEEAYLTRMRTQLARAVGTRAVFLTGRAEEEVRAELTGWHVDEESVTGLAAVAPQRHGVDYLLAASFSSLTKTVHVPDRRGLTSARELVELQMVFSLVDAETGELAWQNSLSSAAAFTTRDFQD